MSDPPPKTVPTKPMRDAPAALPPAEPVVALRIVGADRELPLHPSKRVFTIGSRREPDVDVRLSSAMAHGDDAPEHVSGIHLLVQRRGNGLLIKDQDSTNGTFVGDRREREATIMAGARFRVGDVELLAMDEAMQLLRPAVQWALGLFAHARVDQALEIIATGAPLLLVGPPGCEQATLARAIHDHSARRSKHFVTIDEPLPTRSEQVSLLVLASQGTALVDLHRVTKLEAFFVQHLLGETYKIRPLIATPDFDTVYKVFDEHSPRFRLLSVPPVSERRAEVPRLLDTLIARSGSARTVSELGDDRVAALVAFDWPKNFADLEAAAPRLRALIEAGGNVSAAARALGKSHQALREALERLGIK